MAYVEIKNIPEAQGLIGHLRTLKYVKFISEPSKKPDKMQSRKKQIAETEIKSERSKRVNRKTTASSK